MGPSASSTSDRKEKQVRAPINQTIIECGFVDQNESVNEMKNLQLSNSYNDIFTNLKGVVKRIRFSPDGKYLCCCCSKNYYGEDINYKRDDNYNVILLNGRNLTPIDSFNHHKKGVNDVCFSSDSVYFATCSADSYVYIYLLETKNIVARMKHKFDNIISLCFSYNNDFLFIGTNNGELLKFKIDSQEIVEQKKLFNLSISSLALSPNGQYLAVASHSNIVKIIECEGFKSVRVFNQRDQPIIAKFDKQGKHLVVSSVDKRVSIWNIKDSSYVCLDHDSIITDFQFFSNVSKIICAGLDGRVYVWSFSNQKLIHVLETDLCKDQWGYNSIDINNNETFVVVGGVLETDGTNKLRVYSTYDDDFVEM
eukprot:TRINITY_DN237_c0_g1_i1.p1 TRINITY_DN237_c0_g1~~TRINITY_DN237_c0_g1_i1.p1  ORF type:complete len:366 (-),score=68.30 TRINITY_DN237_c0_g1_i1:207-1304(-)